MTALSLVPSAERAWADVPLLEALVGLRVWVATTGRTGTVISYVGVNSVSGLPAYHVSDHSASVPVDALRPVADVKPAEVRAHFNLDAEQVA